MQTLICVEFLTHHSTATESILPAYPRHPANKFSTASADSTAMSLPDDFLVNHISGSFVEMVQWWIRGRMQQKPEELDAYFRAVIEPIL